ncbi:MAG TPA: hypothetical protein DEG69_09365 [Flavobacteriaceae bacterium]|nr:hypothetical protein [Flavobacteriaceae bacterium]
MPPEIVDDETEEEIQDTVLKTKPLLRRSTNVTTEEPVAPTKKKAPPRTEKQKAALEKGRLISREKAIERKKKKAEMTLGLNPPVEEESVQSPAIAPAAPAPRREPREPKVVPRQEDGNGWKAFAEFLVKDREPKEPPRPKEPPPPKKESPPPPPPQIPLPLPKKKLLFS